MFNRHSYAATMALAGHQYSIDTAELQILEALNE
jgi:hypothetical protein